MGENLVIVESPAKAKTIEKILGKDYEVKSSFGHIRDLSKKKLGIKIDEDFLPVYEVSSDKEKVVEELRKASSKATTVWLASDEDREGEAIAWHLQQTLELNPEKTKRIVFHEITKDAINSALGYTPSKPISKADENTLGLLKVGYTFNKNNSILNIPVKLDEEGNAYISINLEDLNCYGYWINI